MPQHPNRITTALDYLEVKGVLIDITAFVIL